MKEKLSNFIKSRSFYVIISVLLAIVIWILVLNSTNPYIKRTVEIPITFLNENVPATAGLNNRTVTYAQTATVTLSGRADILNNLLLSELSTTVDYAMITKSGITSLGVSAPQCSRLGVKIDDYYPKEIEFEFDVVSEKYLSVIVEYDNDLLKDNYEFVNVIAEPDSIPVSGFASEIEELDYLSVRLSDSIENGSVAANKTASFIGRYILKNGEDATHQFNTEKITVKLEVVKRVPVVYSIKGAPDSNYYYTGVNTISSDTVLLQGSEADLKKISSVVLGDIDISGATGSLNRDISIADYLPEGVTVYGTGRVNVTAEILPYAIRTFAIYYSRVSKPGMLENLYSYDINYSDPVSIQIMGKEDDLRALTVSTMVPTLDLSDKGPGLYIIPLTLTGLNTSKYTVLGELPSFSVTIAPIETE